MKLKALLLILTLLAPINVRSQSDDFRCNCVDYARQFVPLPRNLFTAADKHAIINSKFPRPGIAAIYDFNHVSAVTNVEVSGDGEVIVTIKEANNPTCTIGSRRGTLSQLKIKGFYDARFPVGNTPPQVIPGTAITGSAGRQIVTTIYGDGFDPASVQLVLLGGSYCGTTWGRCSVPTSAIQNRTTRSLTIPLTINSTGRYTLYVFNTRDGRSSNGIPVTIR